MLNIYTVVVSVLLPVLSCGKGSSSDDEGEVLRRQGKTLSTAQKKLYDGNASLSADGGKLVFVSGEKWEEGPYLKAFKAVVPTDDTAIKLQELAPKYQAEIEDALIAPDGSKVLLVGRSAEKRELTMVDFDSGSSEVIDSGVGFGALGFAPDSSNLYWTLIGTDGGAETWSAPVSDTTSKTKIYDGWLAEVAPTSKTEWELLVVSEKKGTRSMERLSKDGSVLSAFTGVRADVLSASVGNLTYVTELATGNKTSVLGDDAGDLSSKAVSQLSKLSWGAEVAQEEVQLSSTFDFVDLSGSLNVAGAVVLSPVKCQNAGFQVLPRLVIAPEGFENPLDLRIDFVRSSGEGVARAFPSCPWSQMTDDLSQSFGLILSEVALAQDSTGEKWSAVVTGGTADDAEVFLVSGGKSVTDVKVRWISSFDKTEAQ